MRMVEELVLDGNAAAGDLAMVFAGDVTTALVACAHCGGVAPLGTAVLYRGAGLVLRCRGCDGVLLCIVVSPGHTFVTASGVHRLELPA